MALVGIALGLALLAIAASAGAATLLTTYPIVFDVLRWAGAAFLVYLAIEAWIGPGAEDAAADSGAAGFKRGLLVNLLNPKAAAVFVVLIPSFITPDRPLLAQTLLLNAIYLAIATAIHLVIVVFASGFRGLVNAPGREKLVRRMCAGALLLVAVWFFLSTAR
jgi:threonine/homoserine/homoserine lactone efflux protein